MAPIRRGFKIRAFTAVLGIWGALVAGISYVARGFQVHASSSVTTLAPAAVFELPGDPEQVLVDLVATDHELISLLRSGLSNRATLLTTDLNGRLLHRADLPDEPLRPVALRRSASGRLAILYRRSDGRSSILLMDKAGLVERRVEPFHAVIDIQLHENSVLGIGWDRIFVVDGPDLPSPASTGSHPREYSATSLLPGGALVLAALESGTVTFVDLSSGVATTTTPSAPEIVRHSPTASRVARPAVFSSVSPSESSGIFLGVTGFQHSLNSGAVSLRVSSDGAVLESLRFRLPAFQGRLLTPDRFVEKNGVMYWAWTRNKTVASYVRTK